MGDTHPTPSPPLGRVVTAMATPFTEDGRLDLDGAQQLASHLVAHGTDTVLVHGTTGESPVLYGDELWQVMAAVREAIGPDRRILMGTGNNDTRHSVNQTQLAQQKGADAVLVVTPYYNKPSQRGLLQHFTEVAAATDLPVLLYDIPGRTSREIELSTLVELAHVDNIIGVKDAVSDLAKAAEVVAATRDVPGGFEVYSGEDAVNLPLLAVGAVGLVSVTSHLAGDLLNEMVRLFETDPVASRRIHADLMPLHRALFVEPSPGPLKGALNRIGLPAGPVRLPLVEAEKSTVDAVIEAMERIGLPTSF